MIYTAPMGIVSERIQPGETAVVSSQPMLTPCIIRQIITGSYSDYFDIEGIIINRRAQTLLGTSIRASALSKAMLRLDPMLAGQSIHFHVTNLDKEPLIWGAVLVADMDA